MSRKYIPVEEAAKAWRKDPEFVAAYDALEEEFALVNALIEARTRAHLSQAEVAKRMGTTQAVVARLEGGGTMPSTRTLERYAKATGHRLRIALVPESGRTA
ncbi:helix-turn-helix domain-containing protein [Roseicella aquatilis]|uniref:XRE family transcriptional regulator n=1 Tax=Roseicella aquatilis TaxID=2527868 RepID=A0A4R4D5C9_9PROT|nr:helix-turn-helix transcriptional regulator [Roseicella aquatilis]TCZ51902.1 XRE family transcriptional regulator [Roseicella aquatilis]